MLSQPEGVTNSRKIPIYPTDGSSLGRRQGDLEVELELVYAVREIRERPIITSLPEPMRES